jgi:anthranilate synthase component 1
MDRRSNATIRPSLEEVRQVVKEGNVVPLAKDLLNYRDETPTGAYAKLGRGPYSFLLESCSTGDKHEKLFSIVGAHPFKMIKTGPNEALTGDPLVHLEEELKKFRVPRKYQLQPSILNGAGSSVLICLIFFSCGICGL